MALELGERLVDVGLVTRAQLARVGSAAHGVELVRRLVAQGLLDEALVGFFLSEGFGPLASRETLAGADAELVGRLPATMACEFLVLPIRETPSGILVAMAVPDDRHVVRETTRLMEAAILPTVARFSDLRRELSIRHPQVQPPAEPERHDSEPPVLQLTTRRRPRAEVLAASEPVPQPTPRSSIEPAIEEDVAVPLVRHKPIASKPPKPQAAVAPEPAPAEPAPAEPAPAEPAPAEPAPAEPASAEPAPANKVGKVVKTFAAPVSRAASAEAFRAGQEVRAKATTSEYVSSPPAVASPLVEPPATNDVANQTSDQTPDPERAPRARTKSDRWDLPALQAKPETKLSPSRMSVPSSKAAAGDITATLATMKSARDRDAIVRLACEGAISVGRSSVFLALRKGVLKGWDGSGQGVSRDSVRNLWIPAGSDSMFKRAIDSAMPFVGAYGPGIADGLFRAAVGSRGGDVAVWPVSIEGKIVGLLCVDDLRPGSISRHRIETLTLAIADGFRRLISTGKND